MEYILQNKNDRIIQTKKTVKWLIENTSVFVFNPLTFEGYQREIDDKHCKKIIKFMKENDFFFPTAIICACDDKYTEETKLRIVDGQHRVEAFRLLLEDDKQKEKFEKMELPIIVLEQVDINKEIETFVNINKKGKKVDTSLAVVLKHTITDKDDLDKRKAKIEFLAVETGHDLSLKENNIWENQICFEGNAKQHNQLISINAFSRSTQFLLSNLSERKIINTSWNNREELESCKNEISLIIEGIWKIVEKKWKEIFTNISGMNAILQGPIGYSSINKFIVFCLKANLYDFNKSFLENFSNWFEKISITSEKWYPKGDFASYSSEAGYSIIAKTLIESMKK